MSEGDRIPKTILDLRKTPFERWTSALAQLTHFSRPDFQKDFNNFIRSVYETLSTSLRFLVHGIAKNPKLLVSNENYRNELIALSEILEVPFEVLLFQNIVYEIYCVEDERAQCEVVTVGCTCVVCEIEGHLTLGRNIDFDYNQYWRRYSFNATVIDLEGKEIGIVNFPAVGTISITTALRFNCYALAINARISGPITSTFFSFLDARSRLPQLVLREVFESCSDYNSSLDFLCSVKLMAPAYFTLVGSNETNQDACVITRERNSFKVNKFCDDSQFLVQTNVDYDLCSDERSHYIENIFNTLPSSESTPEAVSAIVETGMQADLSDSNQNEVPKSGGSKTSLKTSLLWLKNDVMQSFPVCNEKTFSSFIICPKSNLFQSKFIG